MSDENNFDVRPPERRPYSFGINSGSGEISVVTAIPFPCRFICRVHGPTNDFHELDGIRGCNVCSKLSAIAAMRINAHAQ